MHHGSRALLLVLLAFFAQLLFPVALVPDFPVLEIGMVAEEDIIAQVGFPIYKSEAELARERADAAATVEPIFEYAPEAVDTMLARVRVFFGRIDSVASAGGGEGVVDAGVRAILGAYTLPATDPVVDLLLSPRRRAELQRAVERAIQLDLPAGSRRPGAGREPCSKIRLRRDGRSQLLERDSVVTPARFFERAEAPPDRLGRRAGGVAAPDPDPVLRAEHSPRPRGDGSREGAGASRGP